MLTFAVGDVHGRYDKLVRLIDRCRHYADNQPHRFVFLGDYIDRGPDSCEVVEHLLNLAAEDAPHVFLRGNHEQMLLDALLDPLDAEHWIENGGDATLTSYCASEPDQLPNDHLQWLAKLPLRCNDGPRLFVHAGVNPRRPLHRQRPAGLLWIREPFLSFTGNLGRLIVHGHTPTHDGLPDLRPNRLNLDTGSAFDGPLTAAAFVDDHRDPVAFIRSS